MKKLLAAAAVTAGLLFASPLAASAAHQTETVHYRTAMSPIYGSPYPYSGRLSLNFFSNGIVQGYYFSDDGTQMYVPVTGGMQGDHIWLDIGRSTSEIRVNGMLRSGHIVGSALQSDADVPWNFSATLGSKSSG